MDPLQHLSNMPPCPRVLGPLSSIHMSLLRGNMVSQCCAADRNGYSGRHDPDTHARTAPSTTQTKGRRDISVRPGILVRCCFIPSSSPTNASSVCAMSIIRLVRIIQLASSDSEDFSGNIAYPKSVPNKTDRYQSATAQPQPGPPSKPTSPSSAPAYRPSSLSSAACSPRASAKRSHPLSTRSTLIIRSLCRVGITRLVLRGIARLMGMSCRIRTGSRLLGS